MFRLELSMLYRITLSRQRGGPRRVRYMYSRDTVRISRYNLHGPI